MNNLNDNVKVDKKQTLAEWLKEYLIEALKDVPMTIDDFIELKEMLRSELQCLKLQSEYGQKCREFEETLSPEQKKQFLDIEYIGEKLDGTKSEKCVKM